jgi:hypothetical protein
MATDNTFLQAFNQGASLADKARNYQLSLAHLALQQEQQSVASQQAAIAIQTHGYALQHQKEQDAFLAEDLPKIQDWQKQFIQWNAKGDPLAPFPTPPSDLKSIAGLKQVGDMSAPVLANLPMAQNKFYLQKANEQTMSQVNDDVKFAIDHGMGDVVRQNNGGLDDRGRPDQTRWSNIQSAIKNERQKEQLPTTLKPYYDKVQIENPGLTHEQTFLKAMDMEKQTKSAAKSPLLASKEIWQSSPTESNWSMVQAQARKMGQDAVIGPDGDVMFKPALPPQTRAKLTDAVTSIDSMEPLLNSIKEDDIKAAFGKEGALREIGQSLGLANASLGRTAAQDRLKQTYDLLKPLILKGVLHEQLRGQWQVNQGDGILGSNFKTTSPEQAIARIQLLKDTLAEQKKIALEQLGGPSVEAKAHGATSPAATSGSNKIGRFTIEVE